MSAPEIDLTQSELQLRSGRTVKVDPTTETVELRAPNGEIELRITLTDDGPVLHARAAKLELDAEQDVSVKCRDFKVEAQRDIELNGTGDLRSQVRGNAYIDADYVNLNCRDRAGYHDEGQADEG